MNLKNSQDNVIDLMLRFVQRVKVETAMDRRDINRISENVLIPLLSEIYEHKELKNLNTPEKSNFPAIDLGDEKTGTAYQITSRFRTDKIKKTLIKFVEHELYKKFDRLVFYILTEKPETYHGRGLDDIIQGKFSFDKEKDILDCRDLLKQISGFSLDKLRGVEEILEQQFGHESINPLDWLAQVNDLWIEESATFKINREKLLNELLNFTSQGSGVIIGSPGVGKTYLLKELRRNLKSSGTPYLLLPIDQLGDGTPETLRQELSYDGDLIEKLKSVPASGQKSILLFDAFDAARDEQTRKRFLNLIRRATHTLKDSWNVVVTVRTYDAMKSQKLLDSFGPPDDSKYQNKGVLCRHFEIPPLEPVEILQAFGQIPLPIDIYNLGSKEFKCLLAIPFNLWLLGNILKSSQIETDFPQIYSEVQLLDMFWERRIDGESDGEHRRFLLTKVARRMVEDLSMSVRREDVYEYLGLDIPVRLRAWDNLLSDGILEVQSTGQRIAFSHNILFDYAIIALLIEGDPQKLNNFVLQDKSRLLFLLSSVTYFFTRLWYNTPETFWSIFWHVFQSEQREHLRLVIRLIPASTIANEARDIEQLTPLLVKLERREEIANDAMMWLLQSLCALETERDSLWSNFFGRVSTYPDSRFAWNLATLSTEILERATRANNAVSINACGRVGRRLLDWVWQERKEAVNDWYNRFGSYRAVPLVAKTYETDVEESRILLEKVLELTQEDNFPIDFLTSLTEHVDRIWALDPEFVALIYHIVFTHNEISDEKTPLIGGPVLPIVSTRRQDYDMCQYRLVITPSFFNLRQYPQHVLQFKS